MLSLHCNGQNKELPHSETRPHLGVLHLEVPHAQQPASFSKLPSTRLMSEHDSSTGQQEDN